MSDDVSGFTEEERDLIRSSIRRLLAEQWPPLKAIELGKDPAAIRAVWSELGTLSIGDLGRDPAMGGLREVLLAFEELGRAAAPVPLLGALVANLLVAQGVTGAAEALPPFNLYAVGFGTFDGDRAAGSADVSDGAASGVLHFIENIDVAEHFILFLDNPCRVAIVAKSASGVRSEDAPALSLPALASLHLDGAPATVLPVALETLRAIVQAVRLATASRAVGSAQRAFELVVEQATTRKQFGRLIGQFQAVQHRLVDNLTRLDGARLTLDAAARAYDEKLGSWQTFANLAVAHLNPNLRQLAIDMHQLIGAIGYAEEHELPRHFRQIHGNVTRFGGAFRARAEIGAYLVAPAEQSSH